VVAGYGHTAALRADGTLWTWGHNYYGELGITGAPSRASSPQPIDTNVTWTAVAAAFHTAAVRADGTLWTWGKNDFGQLSTGTLTNSSTPQPIQTNWTWRAVAAGGDHTLALRADGTLWGSGRNYFGQIGQPAPYVPSPVLGGAVWGFAISER
jgi:alpha-tubulin suppressor-like RCC1 family protein